MLTQLFFEILSINFLIFVLEMQCIFCQLWTKVKYYWAGFCVSNGYCILVCKLVILLHHKVFPWLQFAMALVPRVADGRWLYQQKLERIDL
jgi:hypothetical protein